MLSLSDFANLDLTQQLACLRANGKYRATRLLDSYCINLYSLYDFFAEVWFDPRHNSIYLISSFSTQETKAARQETGYAERLVA